MTNRRKFIKQMAGAGIAVNIPSIVYPQRKSAQSIRLLIRADDMGNKYDNTLGIIKTFREGIVTSASVMPSSQFFEESVQLCKANPSLAAGIHISLLGSNIRTVLSPELVPSIVTPSGFLYEWEDEFKNANPKAEEIEKEIRAQIEKVRASGLHFVYLDYHRSIPEQAQEIIIKICKEQKLIYGEPYNGYVCNYKHIQLMSESWPNQKMPDGRTIFSPAPAFNDEQKQSFFNALTNLEPGKWMSYVHPGLAEPQRASVTEVLCSPKAKEIIKMKNIQLVSYYDLWEEKFGK